MSCQIFVAKLVMFAQIHPEKFEGAPRFSQKIHICRNSNLKEKIYGNLGSSWLLTEKHSLLAE